ncbi:hypothetical protein KUTeg_022397 [Tegillarca granosa]|uniref:Uncharacterized protein n=1 Tax=Tegillarca granosa TaxID=220873 RepID=A0ABQ9E638_TEGGR|nr:hypothetical protein KUTeg_022397 [Tegillarca granosa]
MQQTIKSHKLANDSRHGLFLRRLSLNKVNHRMHFQMQLGFDRDEEGTSLSHILCRDGVFLEPQGGWGEIGRIYFIVKQESASYGVYTVNWTRKDIEELIDDSKLCILNVFSAKVSFVKEQKFLYAGYSVAASILMGGQAFSCLAPSIVDQIIYSGTKKTKPVIAEIADYELRNALTELGVDKPTCLMTMADKNSLVDDICLSYIIHRTNASLAQFADGMEQLGLVSLIRRNTGLRCLLEYSDSFELDPTILKNHLQTELSPRGSNRRPIEEKLTKRLLDSIDETYKSPRQIDEHEVNLNSFFSFITGLSKLPPIGFDEIAVEFNHEARNLHINCCNFVSTMYFKLFEVSAKIVVQIVNLLGEMATLILIETIDFQFNLRIPQ